MQSLKKFPGSRHQSGVILVTGLVFLVVITLIAVIALQGTGIELRMATNAANSSRAFESSEGLRTITAPIIEEHTFHRSWPDSMAGGVIPAGDFVTPIPTDFTIRVDSGNAALLYLTNTEGSASPLLSYSPLTTDTSYCFDECGNAGEVSAELGVFRTQTRLATGSGSAMVSGYEGLGKSAAAGGGNLFFEFRSYGSAPNNAQAVTATEYRHTIRN